MKVIAFDVETHLIKFVHDSKGKPCGTRMLAPRLVCGSWAQDYAGLLSRSGTLTVLRDALQDKTTIIVGHNIVYDLGVCVVEDYDLLPLVFTALAEGRISDTKIRQKLINIARGAVNINGREFVATSDGLKPAGYSLADLSEQLLGQQLEKEDTWRMRYHELDDVPIEQWPEAARAYPVQDAVTTLAIYHAQEKIAEGPIPNEAEQVQAAFALHLISLWGLRADSEAVASLKDALQAERYAALEVLQASGLVRADGSKDTKKIQALVEAAYVSKGWEVPRTEKKAEPQISEEVLLSTGHADLVVLAKSMSGAKLLSTYVPILEARSKGPVGCNYNALVASGRTSSSSPNDQNPPRKGGVRDCYVPRPGNVFVSADYDTLELRAWAQVLLDVVGWSEMAEALRRGEDLHVSLASEILGCSPAAAMAAYEAGDSEVTEWRQHCKGANFGFPGGMSAPTFVNYCTGQGAKMELSLAQKLHAAWKKRWPEHDPYFSHIKSLLGMSGEGTITQLRSGRVRGGLSFCEAANTFFQGLAADGAKAALFDAQREQYDDSNGRTPLYGCRTVVFMHDEIIMESPEATAHAAAECLAAVMVSGMRRFIPDIPITTTPVLMRRWYKGAKPVRVDGRLVPSRPVHMDVSGKSIVKWVADLA